MRPTHETGTRQAPGWWPSLVQAHCTCGWVGPTRDSNRYSWPHMFEYTLERDQLDHLEEVHGRW